MSTHKDYKVPMVEKTLQILEYLHRNPQASLIQIHQDLGFPKTTTYGIIYTLEKRGMIRKGNTGGFSLGFKLCELGNAALENMDFVKEARPIMEKLAHAIGFTCHLGILEGDFGVYLEKVQPPSPVKLNSWRGKTIPLHCTSIGKILLASKPVKEILEILERIQLMKKTPQTKTEIELILKELLQIKQDGYAADIEENEENVVCFAAPIFDYSGKVIAGISVSGLSTWINQDNKEEIIAALKNATQSISRQFGYEAQNLNYSGNQGEDL
ncbi:MAG: IclR family transcriptional regulator [Peptococcaceae bacterium]